MDKPAICGGTPIRNTKIFYGHQYIDDADIQAVVVTENICCNVRCIPTYYFLYYGMTDQDVTDVINAVTRIVEYYKREDDEKEHGDNNE